MWSKAGPLLFGSLAAVCRGRQNPGAFCTIWVRLRSSDGPGGGGGWGLNSSRALLMPVGAQYFKQTDWKADSFQQDDPLQQQRLKSPFPLR